MLLKFNFSSLSIILCCFLVSFLSCKKKDDKPKTVPVVTTAAVTDVTTTSAVGGGEITSNGNLEITASGLVYSSIVEEPTLANGDKTELTVTSGAFESPLEELNSGTTYHVRAYAINSIGTGYGEVVDFTTGNAAPTATNLSISGQAEVNKELTATYTYSDPESDAQGESTFKWYVANDGTGTGETLIAGATEDSYTVQEAEKGKYIRFGVTVKATTGNTNGTEVKSTFVGAVGEATTVTFMYNGQEVTYGIINSAATGKKWLDRNLGAPNAPSSHTDFANYGDLFQWGRLADGHQLINRTGLNDADMIPVNGKTGNSPYEPSASDNPGHNKFIVNGAPFDWRIPQNDNLWQGVNGTNNPCPSGWRIPTKTEWANENLGTLTEAFTKLKITLTSQRATDSGNIFQSTSSGRYWTSTVDATNVWRMTISSTGTTETSIFRGNGYPCRCIKD